jgi:hypothetical protein
LENAARRRDVSARPNFFLVGAPKCGTTSLAHYLSEHPAIFVSEPKEPSYFARDLIASSEAPGTLDPAWRHDEQAYLGLFSRAESHHRAIGEASTTYLFSSRALREIRDRYPDARIVAMLRNPIDLVQSLHAQKLLEGEESVADFAAAWRLQSEREAGRGLERSARRPRLLLYGRVARLGEQVERLLQIFPREQVHVILFEEFAAAPAETYRRVLEFLGLPDDGRSQFAAENPRRHITRPWLWSLARWRPTGLLAPLRRVGHRIGLGRLSSRLMDQSAGVMPRKELDPALRQELEEFFDEDIRLLESLLEKDLGWRRPRCPPDVD